MILKTHSIQCQMKNELDGFSFQMHCTRIAHYESLACPQCTRFLLLFVRYCIIMAG